MAAHRHRAHAATATAHKAGAGFGATLALSKADLRRIIEALREAGYTVIGPTLTDGAVTLDEILSVEQLARGVSDEQSPGRYRLTNCDDDRWFAHTVGQQSWKRFLHPPELRLFSVRTGEGSWHTEPGDRACPRYALLGVRACDLHAIARLSRVFMDGDYCDPHYALRRRQAFIVAVNCTQASGSCFCTSVNTAPPVKEGFDLALTELTDVFLVQAGSPRGAELLCGLDCRPATSSELQRAADASARLSDQIQRRLRTHGLPELLLRNLEHPRWDAVAQRCLSCGNCTLVCPTCFCTTVNDSADLSGNSAARARLWDSCFTQDFSHVHGGNTRPMTRCRYRQWVTHKFASWAGQFGGLGCTGCGRCITWCPVGIDVAEEINAICEAAAP